MNKTVIKLENVSKLYRLGYIGTDTLSEDLKAFWARIQKKPNPNIQLNYRIPDNHIWALKDINFEIERGEIVGIIGKNGAGKSTLLKLLSRITAPTTGKIKMKGRIGSLLEIGTGFHLELTGRENTYLNGAILGMRKHEIDKKFDEIIDFSGVEKHIDTPVKRYSSGMLVRLAFAVAAHLDPEILIIDEVLAVGDAEFQKKALSKISEVSTREGRTILFVSHNMGSIQQLCNRCLYISNSTIKDDGLPQDIIGKYLDSIKSKKESFTTIYPGFFEIHNLQLLHRENESWYVSPLKFILDISFDVIFTDFAITVSIFNSIDNRILTSWTTLPPTNKNRETYYLELNNHNFAPGNYSLEINISSKKFDRLSYKQCLSFVLDESGVEDSRMATEGDKMGTYVPMKISRS